MFAMEKKRRKLRANNGVCKQSCQETFDWGRDCRRNDSAIRLNACLLAILASIEKNYHRIEKLNLLVYSCYLSIFCLWTSIPTAIILI